MAENSKIEWTDHTFNPWIGCARVSPACDHCYAEAWANRYGTVKWGTGKPRKLTSESNWQQPLKWNREAEKTGERKRVFCASLADVFDNEVSYEWRERLWRLILDTPHLDWLLLTKRIGNADHMLPLKGTPKNVWLGISVVNQQEADRDIPKLLATEAGVRFLSMEPLLGPVSLRWLAAWPENAPTTAQHPSGRTDHLDGLRRIDWVIVGGESGSNARPMHPHWARSLRDQCVAAGVAFHFKQWGEWTPGENVPAEITGVRENASWFGDRWSFDKTNMSDPEADWSDEPDLYMVGKKAAGRLLDGREWNQLPPPAKSEGHAA